MYWYHLNQRPNLSRIVCQGQSSSEGDLEPATPYWLEYLPDDADYQEPIDPRVCVAPSVWQCLSALGRNDGPPSGRFFIYRFEAASTTDPTKPAGEAYISEERWITDEDIHAVGSAILLQLIGWIDVDHPFHQIKMNTLPPPALERMKAEAEHERIWTVCDHCGQWVLNEGGLAAIRREAGL